MQRWHTGNCFCLMRFGVFTEVNVTIVVISYVMSCSLVNKFQDFIGTYLPIYSAPYIYYIAEYRNLNFPPLTSLLPTASSPQPHPPPPPSPHPPPLPLIHLSPQPRPPPSPPPPHLLHLLLHHTSSTFSSTIPSPPPHLLHHLLLRYQCCRLRCGYYKQNFPKHHHACVNIFLASFQSP